MTGVQTCALPISSGTAATSGTEPRTYGLSRERWDWSLEVEEKVQEKRWNLSLEVEEKVAARETLDLALEEQQVLALAEVDAEGEVPVSFLG